MRRERERERGPQGYTSDFNSTLVGVDTRLRGTHSNREGDRKRNKQERQKEKKQNRKKDL